MDSNSHAHHPVDPSDVEHCQQDEYADDPLHDFVALAGLLLLVCPLFGIEVSFVISCHDAIII